MQDNRLSLSTKKSHHNLYSHRTVLEYHVYERSKSSFKPFRSSTKLEQKNYHEEVIKRVKHLETIPSFTSNYIIESLANFVLGSMNYEQSNVQRFFLLILHFVGALSLVSSLAKTLKKIRELI